MKMKFSHMVGVSVAMVLLTPLVCASETKAIEGLRFNPAEMHFGDASEIQMISSEQLGEMPIPILDDSGNGFVKILMPDGSEGWINRSDVRIGGVESKVICAKTRAYAQPGDKRSAHLRGIGRDCK